MRAGSIHSPAETKQINDDTFRGQIDYVIVSTPGARPAAQAFVVRQPVECTLPVHFHVEDQYQLVVGGSGRIGVHEVKPGSLHYASRHSGYGPLTTGPDGLQYLTLRAVMDSRMWPLPENRNNNLRNIRKQQLTVHPRTPLATAGEPDGAALTTETLIAPQDDGLAAWFLSNGRAEEIQFPEHRGGGRFIHVFDGSFHCAGHEFTAGSCVWVEPDETLETCRSGPAGVRLCIAQFPTSALAATESLMQA